MCAGDLPGSAPELRCVHIHRGSAKRVRILVLFGPELSRGLGAERLLERPLALSDAEVRGQEVRLRHIEAAHPQPSSLGESLGGGGGKGTEALDVAVIVVRHKHAV